MEQMKYGVALPYGSARSTANLAISAEEAGWDGVFLGDAIWCEDPIVGLAAAAMMTKRIHLGTMIIPVPLRRPWKIASEALALDRLSDGRLILGLGTGAVWMGWQAFPNENQDTKQRVEMLEETIAILTILFQSRQEDFWGKHFQLKLTSMDVMHYPMKTIQQPRIPIWIPGIWPREKSLQRILTADGVLPEKLSADGKPESITPDDVHRIAQFVENNRNLTTPFDIVINGQSAEMDQASRKSLMTNWHQAGATWWVEGMWGASETQAEEIIRRGPPGF